MPVPVSSTAVSAKYTKSEGKYQSPPECRPFRLLDLPVYHPDDVRTELNGRLVKTLNDVVPLGQVRRPLYLLWIRLLIFFVVL